VAALPALPALSAATTAMPAKAALLGLTQRGPERGARKASESDTMQRKPIPSSDEPLPVIGCGTWQGFDVAPASAEYGRLREVLLALFDAGGSVVDSSPM